MKAKDVAKPELGTKRTCASCSTKYYDLNRDPIVCPNCGAIFEVAAPQRPEPPAEPKQEKPKEAVEVEREDGVVSLEDAEDTTDDDVGPDSDGDDSDEADIPEVEDVEVDEASEGEDDNTFLEEDEEEGNDVSGLLDVEAEDEDER